MTRSSWRKSADRERRRALWNAHADAGTAFWKTAELDEAIVAWRAACRFASAYPLGDRRRYSVHFNLAELYRLRRESRRAIRHYRAVVFGARACVNGGSEIRFALVRLAELYEDVEEFRLAENAYMEFFRVKSPKLTPEDLGVVFEGMLGLTQRTGDVRRQAILRDALIIVTAGLLGSDHPQVLDLARESTRSTVGLKQSPPTR